MFQVTDTCPVGIIQGWFIVRIMVCRFFYRFVSPSCIPFQVPIEALAYCRTDGRASYGCGGQYFGFPYSMAHVNREAFTHMLPNNILYLI